MSLRRGRIIRLRQCVSYVGLLITAIENYEENLLNGYFDLHSYISDYDNNEIPAKLQYLLELLKKFKEQNLKIVIWSYFIRTIELISSKLEQNSYYCEKIYGKTPIELRTVNDEKDRETIINEFVDSNSGLNILIANPAACAESISLHKTCFHSLYYDLSYNLAQYLQSLDRIHRVGGSEINQANYYFLQYENSIDQDIKQSLDKKAERMNNIIDEDFGIYSMNMFEDEDTDEVEAFDRIFKD